MRLKPPEKTWFRKHSAPFGDSFGEPNAPITGDGSSFLTKISRLELFQMVEKIIKGSFNIKTQSGPQSLLR